MPTLNSTQILLLTSASESDNTAASVRAALDPLRYELAVMSFADYQCSGSVADAYEGILLHSSPPTSGLRAALSHLQSQTARPDQFSPPVVVMVDQGEEALAAEALCLGADSYLIKDAEGRYLTLLSSVLQCVLDARGIAENALDSSRDLKRVEAALQESESRFRRVIEANTDEVFLIDPSTMRFVDMNQTACDRLGYTRDELLELGPQDIKPQMTAEALEQIFTNMIESGEGVGVLQTVHRRKNGTDIPVEVYLTSFLTEDHPLVIASVRDITQRMDSEQARSDAEVALKWESDVNAAMVELSQALISSVSLIDITSMVLRKAKALTRSRFGFVGYMDSRLDAMVSASMTRDIWSSCDVPDKSIVFHEYSGLWGWVLQNRIPVMTNAPFADPRSSGVPKGHIPIERFLSAPALIGDSLMGLIALANPDHDYDNQDLAVVKRLASLLALAVEAHRSREALQEYAQKQSVLYAIGTSTASLQAPDKLLSTVLSEALSLLHAQAGWVALRDDLFGEERSESGVRVIASPGLPRTWWGPRPSSDNPKPGNSLETVGFAEQCRACTSGGGTTYDPYRSPAICPILSLASADNLDLDSLPVVEQCEEFPQEIAGLREARTVCIPIVAAGTLFGSFSLVWGVAAHNSDGITAHVSAAMPESVVPNIVADHTWLKVIGQQVGIALQNARLYWEARQLDRLQLLNDFDTALHTSLEPESLSLVTLEHATRALDTSRGMLLLCANESAICFSSTLEADQTWHYPFFSQSEREQLRSLIGRLREVGRVMPLLADGASDLVGESGIIGGENKALRDRIAPGDLIAPVSGEEGIIGLLVLATRGEDHPFGDEDHELLQAIASRAGQTLENAQLYQISRMQTRRLETLNRISSVAAASLETDTVLHHIVKLTAEAVNAEDGSILLTDANSGESVFAATVGQNILQGHRIVRGEGIAGWVVEHDTSLLTNDVASDSRFSPIVDALTGIETRSLLCAPLHHRGRVTGVIEMVNKCDDVFTQDDLELLEAAAAIASVALENARLYTRTRARAEELAFLNEFSMTMTSTLDFRQIVNEALSQIARLFPADGVALIEPDPRTGEFVFRQSLMEGHYLDIDLRVGEGVGLTSRVFSQQQPLLVDDAQADSEYWRGANPHLPLIPRAMMLAPLVIQNQVLGVIIAASKRPGAYSQDDLHMLQGLASTLAVACQNAQLYEDLRALLKERERTQALMVHTEKMAALGRLVASLAHEINNPLQAVHGCLTLALEESEEMEISFTDQEALTYYLHIAETEIDRISTIVRRMRDFYRPAREGMQLTDLHDVLETILSLTNKQLQHGGVVVERSWLEDLPPLQANPDHLKQVFLNLVLNAVDAMPNGGLLTINTRLDSVGASDTAPADAPDWEAMPVIVIEFIDTGMGIPPDAMGRMFEPFFTTKEQGSGLGLSISYSIVKAHNGTISVASQIDVGTTFTIRLPLWHQDPESGGQDHGEHL